MSYYNVYPNIYVNTMVCSTCSTETFSWLAESFNCAVCNDNNYTFPQSIADDGLNTTHSEEEIQTELAEQYKDEAQRHLAKVRESDALRQGEAERGRKRKRSLSDVGGRRA
jgi:hypothetical protein